MLSVKPLLLRRGLRFTFLEFIPESVHSDRVERAKSDSDTARGFRGFVVEVLSYLESQWLIIMGYFKPKMVYFGVKWPLISSYLAVQVNMRVPSY